MFLELPRIYALRKIATRRSQKTRVVVLRHRRPSTAKSVAAIVGLAAISTVLGPQKKVASLHGNRRN